MQKQITFRANPYLSDYEHSFSLAPDGKIKVCDSGGGLVNYAGDGQFIWNEDETGGSLKINNLVGGQPFRKPAITPAIIVKFVKEKGPFYFVGTDYDNHLDVQYLKAEMRYVFETDPLEFCLEYRATNPMFVVAREPELDRRTYYAHTEKISRRELINNNEKFTADDHYCHDIDLSLIKSENIQQIKNECPEIWPRLEFLIERAKLDHKDKRHRWSDWLLTTYYNLNGAPLACYALEAQPYYPERRETRKIIIHFIVAADDAIFGTVARDICAPLDETEINQELVLDLLPDHHKTLFREAVPDMLCDYEKEN